MNEMVAIKDEQSVSSNTPQELDEDQTMKSGQANSARSLGTIESTASTSITEDDITKAREELEKNLRDEQMLNSLQMQLVLQLDTLNASIASAESQERMAKLALKQAEVIRLLRKTQDPNSNIDSEMISLKLQR